jgi:hypothetical protein
MLHRAASKMTRKDPHPSPAARRALLGAVFACCAPALACADVVTGVVTPGNAKVAIVDAQGEVVAQLKPGAYQLQLPVGKYKARCLAPATREQEFLALSEPVTVNIDCS